VGEGQGGVRDELDRDGGEQQPGDPGHQLDAVIAQQPVYGRGEAHGQPDRERDRRHGPGQGESVAGTGTSVFELTAGDNDCLAVIHGEGESL